MDPTALLLAGGLLYLVTRGQGSAPQDDPRPDDADLGAGMLLPGSVVSDGRQLANGRAVAPGQYAEGMTIEVVQAEPFMLSYSRTGGKWAPMASGKYAPKWGAAGMPVRSTNPRPNGAAAVPSDAGSRIRLSYASDYPSAKPPRRRLSDSSNRIEDSDWSGVVVVGDEPRWRPFSGGPGVPDASPQAGTIRRLRGIRTQDGVALVAAADSVNWSSLEANTLPGEKRAGKSHRLFVGADAWTVVETGPEGSRSITRADAEQRLAWVVPGTAARVDRGDKTDATLRKNITGADGRPGGKAWEAFYFRALAQLRGARGALAIDRDERILTLGLDYPRAASVAYLSGWKEFKLTPQNVVPTQAELVCTARSDEWDASRPISSLFGDRCVAGIVMAPAGANRLFNMRALDEYGERQGGPMAWARGTASQYQTERPAIPFALEAPVLMRTLINKTYTRAIR